MGGAWGVCLAGSRRRIRQDSGRGRGERAGGGGGARSSSTHSEAARGTHVFRNACRGEEAHEGEVIEMGAAEQQGESDSSTFAFCSGTDGTPELI